MFDDLIITEADKIIKFLKKLAALRSKFFVDSI